MPTLRKSQMLEHWASLRDNQPIMPHFTPVSYKARGSRYGACGIRIDGNEQFVDAVLSRLKDLIEGENDATRLDCSYTEVDGSKLNKAFNNKEEGAICCYIRVAERGRCARRVRGIISNRSRKVEKDDDEFLE